MMAAIKRARKIVPRTSPTTSPIILLSSSSSSSSPSDVEEDFVVAEVVFARTVGDVCTTGKRRMTPS